MRVNAEIRGICFFLLLGAGCVSSDTAKPNIILISIDTLRASNMSCYGYSRNTTPFIDSLSTEGVIFTACQAQSPWTLPSHASMFTGLSVVSHRTGFFDNEMTALDITLPSLPVFLSEHGYRTAGFVNVEFLSPRFAFDNGFDHYWYNEESDVTGVGGITVSKVLEWLIGNTYDGVPFFLFIHFWDVHAPYDSPPPFDGLYGQDGKELGPQARWNHNDEGEVIDVYQRDAFIARYDGCINYTDQQLERLFAWLRQSGLAENTIIIITADHGEEFLEHGGVYHGETLYQELLHIPLIITGPGVDTGLTDASPCGLFDIFPTCTALLDLPCPSPLEGVDLFSDRASEDRFIPSSGLNSSEPDLYRLAAILRDSRKLILEMSSLTGMEFDLSLDPAELEPMVPESMLIRDAEDYWSTPPLGDPDNVDISEIEDLLKGLGYIQ